MTFYVNDAATTRRLRVAARIRGQHGLQPDSPLPSLAAVLDRYE
jgi:hypothetical protein